MTTLTINGAVVHAPEGCTVLAAARAHGIHIPTLCHHDALADVGACRICVVEVTAPGRRPTVLASCTLPVSEGLVVETHSERAKCTRRMMVELLLARAPDTAVMRALADEAGVVAGRFRVSDTGDCVLCGRCVRACSRHAKAATTAFAGRGRDRHVARPFEKESDVCLGCGACAQLCPTGAVCVEDRGGQRRILLRGEVVRTFRLIRCESCGEAYTTQPWLQRVRERVAEPELPVEIRQLCPRCGRRTRARQEAKFARD